jgi:hypothetical protein
MPPRNTRKGAAKSAPNKPTPIKPNAKRARKNDDDDDDDDDDIVDVSDGDDEGHRAVSISTAPIDVVNANRTASSAASPITTADDSEHVNERDDDGVTTTSSTASRPLTSTPFLTTWEIQLNRAVQTSLLATSDVYINVYIDDITTFSGYYQIILPLTHTGQAVHDTCFAVDKSALFRTLSRCDPRIHSLICYRPAMYSATTGVRISMLEKSVPWFFIKPLINFILISERENHYGVDVLVSTTLPASLPVSLSSQSKYPPTPESHIPERITTVGEALDRYHRYKADETRMTVNGVAPMKKDVERFTNIARNSHASDKAIFLYLTEAERSDPIIRRTTLTVMKDRMKNVASE